MSSRLQVVGAIVVVAVVLGGYLLRDVGGGGAAGSATDTTATAPARNTTTTAAGYDLAAAERSGGHTLAEHVGRTDAQLVQRLRDEPDISAASTYSDRATAERVVAAALAKGTSQIRTWELASSHPNLVLRVTMPDVVGRSVAHGSTKVSDVRSAVVVLAWDGKSWFVLTSYPEAR